MLLVLAAAVLISAVPGTTGALHAYGHAFSRPDDFTHSQIAAVASRFEIFTVEKGTAENHYGRRSSIAATTWARRAIIPSPCSPSALDGGVAALDVHGDFPVLKSPSEDERRMSRRITVLALALERPRRLSAAQPRRAVHIHRLLQQALVYAVTVIS
jgi:hypothetical protein